MGMNCTQCNAYQEPQLDDEGLYTWECTSCGARLAFLRTGASREELRATLRKLQFGY